MAYTADYKSHQVTQYEDTETYDPLKPWELGARVRPSSFYALPTGVATDEVVALCYIPKGAHVHSIGIAVSKANTAAYVELKIVKASDGTTLNTMATTSTSATATTDYDQITNTYNATSTGSSPSVLTEAGVLIATVKVATVTQIAGVVYWSVD